MTILEALRIAFAALNANKTRAALTTLGVVIGVGAVIAMTALGQGAAKDVQDRLSKLGSNVLFLSPGSNRRGGMGFGFGSGETLTTDDIEGLRRDVPEVGGVAPEQGSGQQVKFGSQSNNYRIIGTYSDYAYVRNVDLASGHFFTRLDEDAGRRVAVVGSNIVRDAFGGDNTVGQTIKIKGVPFTVIGTLASVGGQGRMDDQIFIPLKAFMQRIEFRRNIWNVSLAGADGYSMEQVQAAIKRYLRRRHALRPGQPDDFTMATQSDIATTVNSTSQTFTYLLGGIAAISLLVGGIGIMNIMLVTVTERTREIGIRKALGARRADIQLQFLIESCVLSILGGLLGVLLGVVSAKLMEVKMALPVQVTTSSMLLSFGCAAAIGIFFGLYPASRAAALDPIQALRYE